MTLLVRIVPLLCAALVAAPPAARAQSATDLAAGTRVRVVEPAAGRIVGTIAGVRGDTLLVASRGGVHALPVSSIRTLQVSRGRPPRLASALEGGALGLLTGTAGAIGGILLADLTVNQDCEREEDPLLCLSTGQWVLLGVMIGAPMGAASGAVLGFAFPRERWRSIPVAAAPALTLHPRGGGVQVGITLRVP